MSCRGGAGNAAADDDYVMHGAEELSLAGPRPILPECTLPPPDRVHEFEMPLGRTVRVCNQSRP
jgi:hypothetical protein